jgi:16S rRNA C1402 (ribose-2'-O) methylase RsmI
LKLLKGVTVMALEHGRDDGKFLQTFEIRGKHCLYIGRMKYMECSRANEQKLVQHISWFIVLGN